MRHIASPFFLVLAALSGLSAGGNPVFPEAAGSSWNAPASPAGAEKPSGAVSAPEDGGIRVRGGKLIKFPEPVVSRTVSQNSRKTSLSPSDRGTDLFTISGDSSPLPSAYWDDQDELLINYPAGSSCTTEYCLTFKPGTTYLSKKPLEPRTIRFFRPSDTTLEARHLSGTPDSFLVYCESKSNACREAMDFGPQSPVTYKFRAILRDKKGQRIYDEDGNLVYGEEIPAAVRASTLADGLNEASLATLFAKHRGKLSRMKQSDVIPGQVVVTPERPLDTAKEWYLWAFAPERSGFRKEHAIFCLPQASATLTTQVAQQFHEGRYGLTVEYSEDMQASALEDIFRRLTLRIGEHTATLSPDGRSWTLSTPDQTLTFRFVGVTGKAPQESCSEPGNLSTLLLYEEPDTNDTFFIAVSGMQHPAVLDITLPEGARAKRGLAQAFAITHRLSLNPYSPMLIPGSIPQQLPLTGKHTLRFQTLNQQAVRVKAYHWDADHAAAQYDLIRASLIDDTAFREASYFRQLLQAREDEGMPHDISEEQRDAFELGWKELRIEQKKGHRRAAMTGATAFPDYLIPVVSSPAAAESPAASSSASGEATASSAPSASTTVEGSGELSIDLDTLTGGKTRPGLYLIAVTSQPSPAVREALKALELPENALDCTTEYLVQVSDLQVTTRETLVSLFSGADGSPVGDARARFFTKTKPGWFSSEDSPRRLRESATPQTFRQGIMRCGELPHLLLIQAGDDYLLLPKDGNRSTLFTGNEPIHYTLTDRDLYRPGDTVYLHSILRYRSPTNQLLLPKQREGTLTVFRPNHEVLLTKKVELDAFGCCDASFTLPEGEEDVTGEYSILLKGDDDGFYERTHIRCEVFRRDSMSGKLSLDTEAVSPRQVSLRVQGEDLNGTALAGARVELTLTVPGKQTGMSHLIDGLPDTWKRNKPETITRNLTLDSNGCATFSTELLPLGTHSAGFTLRAQATLVNDREERFELTSSEQRITPGNLVLGLDGSRLTVSTPDGQPWGKAQSVRVRVYGDSHKQTALGNGFSKKENRLECLRDLTVTVPANSPQGVALPLKDCADQTNQYELIVLLDTKDDAGRTLAHQCSWRHWFGDDDASYTLAEARCENRQLIIPATFRTAGTALVTLHAGRRVRSLFLPVQAGRQEYRLPLQPDEVGEMDFCITLMERDGQGVFKLPVTVAGSCDTGFTHQRLDLSLDLPADPPLPGSQVTLSGTVLQADGQPAADAAVTFYAVDAGMLSLSGYTAPAPLLWFYETKHIPFSPSMPLAQNITLDVPLQPEILPGLWLGDVISGPVDSFEPWKTLVATSAFRKSYGRSEKNSAGVEYAPAPVVVDAYDSGSGDNALLDTEDTEESTATAPAPRLRTNFVPVAFWQGNLRTDAQGRFSTTCTLPDTLTTYRIFAIAAADDGQQFGSAEGELQVNQPVMLTPGTPLFMSTGDCLSLPLTITNNTKQEDTWTVRVQSSAPAATPQTAGSESPQGSQAPDAQGTQTSPAALASQGTQGAPSAHVSPTPQQIRLAPGQTGTLYFDVTPKAEGQATLTWTAEAQAGGDAVAGSFDVRFPAPVLRESHRLVLQPGQPPTALAQLPAPELAGSTRGSVRISLSANPMIHLAGCADFLCSYPFGCTEQTASALLPYLLHERLAPFTPSLRELPEKKVEDIIEKSIERLFDRQRGDGGLGYWGDDSSSSPWATAYAGMVLTIADELGYDVPSRGMRSLRAYLRRELKQDDKRPEAQRVFRTLTLYAAGRTLGDDSLMDSALQQAQAASADIAACRGRDRSLPDLLFIRTLRENPGERHAALLSWLRSRGHDYRHRSSWSGGWTLLALAEYLKREPQATSPATVRTETGQELTLGNGSTDLPPAVTQGKPLSELPTTLEATQGTVYANVHIRALPETTHFPGVTEKGLQVTRLYEKKGEDGIWRPASKFAVGDVIRITLTCAKMADEVEYLVLEDYLPASMEAINPAIPSQAAGLEPLEWSAAFDHREYLADRVRGFCTRWATRDIVNLRYYARVKRAGTATAPPASAQLMYEPQCYGLSENRIITTK